MEKRILIVTAVVLCLAAMLAGCGRTMSNPSQDVELPEDFENSMIIIGGGDGIIGMYPEKDPDAYEEPEWTEPTEPPQKLVDLPDGTQVPEENVQTLEDGTVVAFTGTEPTGHKCFFSDGTYAYTRYTDSEGSIVAYQAAERVSADWYLANGEILKEAYYSIKADGELFLLYSYEYEYTQIEIGTEDSPWYHSATNERWYEEDEGIYKTARSEYDSLHGSDCPIYCVYYDGSYSEHEYNLDGTQKKSVYYSANGKKTQADFFENGQMVTQYLFREDGSQQFVTHYKDGNITTEYSYGEGGSYQSITHYKNGYRTYTHVSYKDGRASFSYYDEVGCTVKEVYNNADGSLDWYVYYESYSDGSTKKATYYDADGNITEIEEYDQNGNRIE